MRRLSILFIIGLVAGAWCTSLQAQVQPSSAGPDDFNFLVGEWQVHHRRLNPSTQEWVDFEGTASNRKVMAGAANIEEHALNSPTGSYRAVALRSFDATAREWAIWWLDERYPSGPLDPPVKGRFEKGIGSFYADYVQDGKPMRGRFVWSNITPTSARWEQSSSSDGGKTWAANWIMTFHRIKPKLQASAHRAGSHDFDFLVGNWRVNHRYLRVKGNSRAWLNVDGTMTHRELLDGRANVDEYVIDAPVGAYHAVALRSYDPKASQWSIWWLDGRTPHGDLDPPVQGRFENGVGTFYGSTTLDGRPMRLRFVWSQITGKSARWEQAYSPDAGRTWETNWIMEFRRTS